MSGKCKYVVLLLLASVVLFSCASSAASSSSSSSSSSKDLVWDDALNAENTTTITVSPGVDIKLYNGIAVQWKTNPSLSKTIKLPAGKIEFVARYSSTGAYYYLFEYNFEAGKEYQISGGEKGNDIGIKVFEKGDDSEKVFKARRRDWNRYYYY